jgi:hypothetical protein
MNKIEVDKEIKRLIWTAPQGLDTCVRIDGSLT